MWYTQKRGTLGQFGCDDCKLSDYSGYMTGWVSLKCPGLGHFRLTPGVAAANGWICDRGARDRKNPRLDTSR